MFFNWTFSPTLNAETNNSTSIRHYAHHTTERQRASVILYENVLKAAEGSIQRLSARLVFKLRVNSEPNVKCHLPIDVDITNSYKYSIVNTKLDVAALLMANQH